MASLYSNRYLKAAVVIMNLVPCIIMAARDPCKRGQYTVTKPDGISFFCINCPDCGHGYGNILQCDSHIYLNATIDCDSCILGKTYSSENSKQQCQPCNHTTCHHNEEVVGECSLVKDTTKCNGTCVKGYYWSANRTDPCQPDHRNAKEVTITTKHDRKITTKITEPTTTPEKITEPNQPSPRQDTKKDNTTTTQMTKTANTELSQHLFSIIITIFLIIVALMCCFRNYLKGCFTRICCDRCSNAEAASRDTDVEQVGMPLMPSSQNDKLEDEEVWRYSAKENNNQQLAPGNIPGVGTSPSLSGRSTPSIQEEATANEQTEHDDACSASFYIENTTEPVDQEPITANNENTDIVDASSIDVCVNTDGRSIPIDKIPTNIYMSMCRKLDLKLMGKDWRAMVGEMHYENCYIKDFAKNESPSDAVLSHWRTEKRHDVHGLVEILENLKRDDIVESIQNWLLEIKHRK